MRCTHVWTNLDMTTSITPSNRTFINLMSLHFKNFNITLFAWDRFAWRTVVSKHNCLRPGDMLSNANPPEDVWTWRPRRHGNIAFNRSLIMLRQLNEPKIHFSFIRQSENWHPNSPFVEFNCILQKVIYWVPSDAADVLRDWYQELYSANDVPSEASHFVWPFTPEELTTGLQTLPPFKALAPEYAPAPIWQAAASYTAAYLWSIAVLLLDYRHVGVTAHWPFCASLASQVAHLPNFDLLPCWNRPERRWWDCWPIDCSIQCHLVCSGCHNWLTCHYVAVMKPSAGCANTVLMFVICFICFVLTFTERPTTPQALMQQVAYFWVLTLRRPSTVSFDPNFSMRWNHWVLTLKLWTCSDIFMSTPVFHSGIVVNQEPCRRIAASGKVAKRHRSYGRVLQPGSWKRQLQQTVGHGYTKP